MEKSKRPAAGKNGTSLVTKRNIFLFIGAGIIILVIAVLLFMESIKGKLTIINDSGLKLNYVEAVFTDIEGFASNKWRIDELAAGDKSTIDIGEIKLLGREANLRVRFEFEGYEENKDIPGDSLFIDAGYFNEDFGGKITIKFTKGEEDTILLNVNAKNGLLPSALTQCDEKHNVKYKENFIEE